MEGGGGVDVEEDAASQVVKASRRVSRRGSL